jgi:SAM-dependent methyltransferase
LLLVLGVDPSQDMLDVFRTGSDSNPNIETVCMDAATFSQSIQYSPYDRIFLKGMIHLLTHEDRLIAFEGFYKQLAPKNGNLLIITNHQAAQCFPFDERTKSLFEKILDINPLYDELKHAGFKQIQEETFTYEFPPNSVKAEDWIYLIENRLWTIFSKENINDEQMKDLIDHVKKQYTSLINFQTIDKQTIIKCSVE